MPIATGIPEPIRATVKAEGFEWALKSRSQFLRIDNTGGLTLRLYLGPESDYVDDVNYREIGAGTVFEGPAVIDVLRMRAAGAPGTSTTIDATAYGSVR